MDTKGKIGQNGQKWTKLHKTEFNKIDKKFTLFEKSNFCPKNSILTKPQHFRDFSTQIFWQFFSWNKSCQQLRSAKPQHFREFFTQIFWQFFSWNQSCQQLKSPKPQHFHEFLDKNWTFNIVCSLGFFSIFRALWSGVTFSKVHLELKKRKKKI